MNVSKKPDVNWDRLSGTPGSHPVGTSRGAAADGVAAGAAGDIPLATQPVRRAKIDPTVVDGYWLASPH